MSPTTVSPTTVLIASLATVSMLVAGCSNGVLAQGEGSSTPTQDTQGPSPSPYGLSTSTSVITPEPTSTTSTTEADPGLRLVPTTSITIIEEADPPAPVADPGGPPGRNSVMVVGDSVFLGTASAIPREIPDWLVTYDAVGSRRLAQVIELFVERREELGEAVVIHLGNNYIPGERGDYPSQIEEVMGVLWFVPRVVWVTVAEVYPSRVGINAAIRDAATRWPNLRVADWAPKVAMNPQWTWDGLHLTGEGRRKMAELVAETLGPVGGA